jgi:tungstate transport system substrate-binding protein
VNARLLGLVGAASAALGLVACGGSSSSTNPATASGSMILATTTDTQDSGLLDVVVPAFEHTSKCTVKTVAVGSGQAIDLAQRGQADALLVHSPKAEEKFMSAGRGLSRQQVMTNPFEIVGPPSDAAAAAATGGAVAAFRAIATARAAFASRADQSGTNTKELEIWKQAGITPSGSWYIQTGQGMGPTLTIASQKRAYTLTDTATMTTRSGLGLKVLVSGDPVLANPYHVIVVKGAQNLGCARAFADYLVGSAGQRLIGAFGVAKYGRQLYHPDAGAQ